MTLAGYKDLISSDVAVLDCCKLVFDLYNKVKIFDERFRKFAPR